MSNGLRLAFVCAIALLPLQFAAQEVTGNVTGTVLDSSGAAVSSARVTVTETSRSLVLRELQTNDAGLYSVTLLPRPASVLRQKCNLMSAGGLWL
jgi:hypothetical protein